MQLQNALASVAAENSWSVPSAQWSHRECGVEKALELEFKAEGEPLRPEITAIA